MVRRAVTVVVVLGALAGAVRLLVVGQNASAGEGRSGAVSTGCSSASGSCSRQLLAPSGNAVLNQYLETVPSAGGGRPSNQVQQSLGSAGGAAGSADGLLVSASTARRLRTLGRNGSATLALAEATASGARSPSHDSSEAAAAGSRLAVVAAVASGSGSSGIGAVLPVALILSAAAAVIVVSGLRRRD